MNFTELAENWQELLGQKSNQIARECGFIQRQGKLSGASFVQGLVFKWMQTPTASLSELSQSLHTKERSFSPQGLDQRFSPQAVLLMRGVFEQALHQIVAAEPVTLALLGRFEAVYLLDSSTISLPAELAEWYRGCGKEGSASFAGLKLHVQLDLVSGALSGFEVTAARCHDAKSALAQAHPPKGTLRVRDLGYWNLGQLAKQTQTGSYFVSRLKADSCLVDSTGKLWQLADFLAAQSEKVSELDLKVGIGRQKPVFGRLIALRVQEEQVQVQRQKQLKEQARKRQLPISTRQKVVSQWLVYFTNLPSEKASLPEIVVLYRLRWQIELLFKLWKQQAGLAEWRSKKPYRILCELFAKLIGVILTHQLSVLSGWSEGDRSLVKAGQVVRSYGSCFHLFLFQTATLVNLLGSLARVIRQSCRLNKRQKHPAAFQLCLDPNSLALT